MGWAQAPNADAATSQRIGEVAITVKAQIRSDESDQIRTRQKQIMNETKRFSRLQEATAAFMMVSCALPVSAGTQGAYMNSAGYGKAVDRIVYANQTNVVSSISMYNPCAGVNETFSCLYKGGVPPGTPSTVYCQSKGAPNYIWSIQSYVTGGASADHPELESIVPITAANCAAYTLDSSAVFTDAYSGTITVKAMATGGAALRLRGLEFLGPGTPQSLDDLLGNSLLKWDMLLVGPFDLTSGCGLPIAFTAQSGHTNLYFVTDGVAKSIPFTISCPQNLRFGCSDPVVYPEPQIGGGCGKITVTYNPPTNALPSGTNIVIATATDESGNSAQCTFTATRQLGFKGFYPPIGGLGGSCGQSLLTVNRGSIVPVKFDTFCAGSPFVTGQPTLAITKCPNATPFLTGNFQMVANEWHFNWDTSGLPKGDYLLVATLQDGSTPQIVVTLK
jgi:hypothetical protein